MADWRIGRGWSEDELIDRLHAIHSAARNFDQPPDTLDDDSGWHEYSSEAVVARESPGPPVSRGPFERGCEAVINYQFSDPRIVTAHFDPDSPLLGRRLLLEMRAVHVLHYLGGVVVGRVRRESSAERSVFGFRYETLEGHIERGAEWFLLSKDHNDGSIRFRIQAAWLPGDFPNWWSRAGFVVLGPHYQEKWHRRAHAAMSLLTRDRSLPLRGRRGRRLMHDAPEVIFNRTEVRDVA